MQTLRLLSLLLGRIACAEGKDAASCYSCSVVCLSVVCLLFTSVSTTKTAEPIEMSFGLWTRVGPRNDVLGEARIPLPSLGRDNFGVVSSLKCIRLYKHQTPQHHGAADLSAGAARHGESAASEWTHPLRG